jgi:signal transduction histidine kinase
MQASPSLTSVAGLAGFARALRRATNAPVRRSLFLISIVLTIAEFGCLAALLHLFLGVGSSELGAATISLVPSLLVLFGPWTLLANRWTLGLRADAPVDRVREEVVQLPRRILFLRSTSTAIVALGLAPVAAHRFHLDLRAAAVIAGTAVIIAYSFNVVRAWAYRGILDGLAQAVYATDPLRYEARTARERIFVAANLLGILGTGVGVAFTYFIVGAPLQEYATLIAVFPFLVVVLCVGFGVDLIRATRPAVDWATHQPHTSAAAAFGSAASVPYRLALSNLVAWFVGGGTMAYAHWDRGALFSEVVQVFAGVVAVGCGVVMYQAAWHRQLLAPLRDAAASELMDGGGEVPRSRLSLQVKLNIVVLLLLGFGGTFALTTTYAEHERTLSLAAGQRAEEELTALVAREPTERLATAARGLKLSGGGTLFVQREDGFTASSAPLALPESLTQRVAVEESGIAAVPALHASAAWRHLPGAVRVGVVQPWRSAGQGAWSSVPLIFVFVSLLVAAIGAMWLFAQELTTPVRALAHAAARLGRGELDEPIVTTAADEVGSLASALEVSRRQLKHTLNEVRQLNAGLEQRVKDRTAALESTNGELGRAMGALRAAQQQVVATEKLASLGRLSAGIAHEVNNPLNFVKNALPPLKLALDDIGRVVAAVDLDPSRTDAELASRIRQLIAERKRGDVETSLAESRDVVRIMENGVARMALILRALLDFSRQSPEEHPVKFELAPAIESALALLRHDLRDRVDVTLDVEGVDALVAQPGPIGQVIINLVKNGIEAIDGRGTIRIGARRTAPHEVELSVHDSGKGMQPEAIQRAFEPFFTTKPVGKGTGLGLSMVHGIVLKHGGAVTIDSVPGQGTTVRITLPQPV